MDELYVIMWFIYIACQSIKKSMTITMIIAIVANINRTAALVSTSIFNALVQDCDGVLSIPETVHGLRQVQSHLGRWIILGKATLMNYHWSTQCPIQRWIFTMNTPICISTHIYLYLYNMYIYIYAYERNYCTFFPASQFSVSVFLVHNLTLFEA